MLYRTIVPDEQELRAELEAAPWLEATGIVRYDPHRGDMKARTKWWAVLELDNGISDYYRNQITKHYGIKLHQPSWGAHVSILRGEKPRDDLMHLWKKYDGQRFTIKYRPYVRFNGDTCNTTNHMIGNFWFLDVLAPELSNIRKELELPHDWLLHLTVGRKWD